jgi:hypothetical protein
MAHPDCWQPFLYIVWTGGWGFAFVRYPSLVGLFATNLTPKGLRIIRIVGIVAVTLALVAFPVELARFAINCLH